jgi:hypothetical protein
MFYLIFLSYHVPAVLFDDQKACEAARYAVLSVSTLKAVCVAKGEK